MNVDHFNSANNHGKNHLSLLGGSISWSSHLNSFLASPSIPKNYVLPQTTLYFKSFFWGNLIWRVQVLIEFPTRTCSACPLKQPGGRRQRVRAIRSGNGCSLADGQQADFFLVELAANVIPNKWVKHGKTVANQRSYPFIDGLLVKYSYFL